MKMKLRGVSACSLVEGVVHLERGGYLAKFWVVILLGYYKYWGDIPKMSYSMYWLEDIINVNIAKLFLVLKCKFVYWLFLIALIVKRDVLKN